MKVIIAGGRDYADYERLKKVCTRLLMGSGVKEIVSGGAEGADKLGESFAIESAIQITVFPAEWDNVVGKFTHEIGDKNGRKYWKLAGIERNKKMAAYADALIVFWNMKSKGTKNMIDVAREYKLPVIIVTYHNE
jgi:predicted Rossmann fold nucleotide-binding protein DprA/Smf involved in DNA uptake